MKRNIIAGLLVGGAVGSLVAFLIAPTFFMLGLLAGMAAGFLSGYCAHNASGIIGAMPKAREMVSPESARLTSHLNKVSGAFGWIWRGLKERYVPISMLVILIVTVEAFVMIIFLHDIYGGNRTYNTSDWIFVHTLGAIPIAVVMFFFFFFIPLATMYHFGRGYAAWLPADGRRALSYKDGKLLKPNLRNTLFLCLLGWPCLIISIIKWVAIIIYSMLVLAGKFVWYLFKLIHSKEGVLCGVDSAVGTFVTFLLFQGNAKSVTELAAVTACGAIISLALGVIDYEIVSKRVLKLRPA